MTDDFRAFVLEEMKRYEPDPADGPLEAAMKAMFLKIHVRTLAEDSCVCGTRCLPSETSRTCPRHGWLVRAKRIEAAPDNAKAEIEVWEPEPAPPTSVPRDPHVQPGMFRSFDAD